MHPTHLACPGWIRFGALVLTILLAAPPARAQEATSKPENTAQLEQLVAPIALYPDSLVAQILMASTYPLEVVEAARWVKAHADLKGKALENALQSESWDPSIKSLTAFPQTLGMMNDKLDWTTQLGDAFLAQQKSVMNAVQSLRQKAKAAGNLKSNEQQTVKVEPEPTGSQTQTIIIEPANPQVVYVPTYNPMMIYGPWPYPMYQPFYWYPPGYVAATSMVSFGVGLAVGAAVWGDCNWGRSDVNINVNRYNSFNRTNINNSTWKHDNTHRRGVGYRDQNVRNKYGGNSERNQKARDSFRGHAEKGRQQIARGNADQFKGNRPQSGGFGGNREGLQQRSHSGRGNGAFSGIGNGNEARRNADRGRASRDSFGGGGWGGDCAVGRDHLGATAGGVADGWAGHGRDVRGGLGLDPCGGHGHPG